MSRERPNRRARRPGKREPRALIAAVAAMSAVALIATGVMFGPVVALACLTVLVAIGGWREARIARGEKNRVQAKLDKLSRERGSVIEVLCGALGLEKNVKAAQARRVAELTAAVAWQLRLREDEINLVRQAAILHDVGKIGIAENVLGKPDTLNDSEWKAMMKHPEVGHEVLNEVPSLRGVADIVHAHHERFDGQGYPRGLKGDDIPIGSRIFAVVDAYAAMTSDRPYRKKMEHDVALREIVRNSLTQFDPQVVEAFLEAIEGNRKPNQEPNHGLPVERSVPTQV